MFLFFYETTVPLYSYAGDDFVILDIFHLYFHFALSTYKIQAYESKRLNEFNTMLLDLRFHHAIQ